MSKYVSLFALYLVILVNPGATQAEARPPAARDWPAFMHDNQRSGVTSERLELPPLCTTTREAALLPSDWSCP